MIKFPYLATVLLLSATLTSQAQLKKSSEPRPTQNMLTGEVILMPTILTHDVPKLAAAESKVIKPISIRNRSQMRTNKWESTRNGYYKGPNKYEWGTNMRLNNFFFLPASTGL